MTHQCKQCPENNPDNFYARSRNKCKKCTSSASLSRYHNLDPKAKADYMEKVKKWRGRNLFQYRCLSAKHRAAKKGIEFSITAADLEAKYQEQSGKCFYSNIPLGLVEDKKFSLSVDRINSKKGYTPDNVVLVCFIVNTMKSDLSAKEFLDIITKLYNHMT